MTDEQPLSPEVIRERAKSFTNLKWVMDINSYVQTVQGLNAPETPPDGDGMATKNRKDQPILTVPALMTRALGNAAKWQGLLGEMEAVAGSITDYAIKAQRDVKRLVKLGKDKLAPAQWKNLSRDDLEQIKADFKETVRGLIAAAGASEAEAKLMRDKLLQYRDVIEADQQETQDIKAKYKNWIAEEDKILHVWEEQHGLKAGDTTNLLAQLQVDIDAFNKKWIGLSSGAGGAAGTTVAFGLVVFPPFGAIGMLIAMSVMAGLAEQARKEMEEFKDRLRRVKRFNAVKLFFDVMEAKFDLMISAIDKATTALETVAGLWSKIALDLRSVQGATIGVGALSADDLPWDAPADLLARIRSNGEDTDDTYSNLIEDCDVFIKYRYVRDLKKIEAGKLA